MLRAALEARLARLLERAQVIDASLVDNYLPSTLAAPLEAMIDSSLDKLVNPQLRSAVRGRPELAERWPLGVTTLPLHAPEALALRALWRLESGAIPSLDAQTDYPNWLTEAHALIVATERNVVEGRLRQAMAIDAGHPHHSLVGGMRDIPKDGVRKRGAKATLSVEDGFLEVLAPDAGPIQLHFPLQGLNESILETLRAWRGPKGIRHWAALQRLLSIEGGRTGRVTWKLDEHLDALGYAERSRQDPKVRDEVAHEVELLTKMELAVYDGKGRLRLRQALITPITKAERQLDETGAWALEGLVLEVHPLLYDGVRDPKTGQIGTNWYPQAAALAQIDDVRFPFAIALGLILPMRWRWAWAQGVDHCALTGGNLLRAAGINYERSRATRAWASLRKTLDELQRIDALGRHEWAREPETLDGVCRLYPPQWAIDRTIHALPPVEVLKPKPPSTGKELVEWRKGREWTQAQLAEQLGIGIATVKRAESARDAELGPAITKGLNRLFAAPPLPPASSSSV